MVFDATSLFFNGEGANTAMSYCSLGNTRQRQCGHKMYLCYIFVGKLYAHIHLILKFCLH